MLGLAHLSQRRPVFCALLEYWLMMLGHGEPLMTRSIDNITKAQSLLYQCQQHGPRALRLAWERGV